MAASRLSSKSGSNRASNRATRNLVRSGLSVQRRNLGLTRGVESSLVAIGTKRAAERGLAPGQTSIEHKGVEAIILRLIAPDRNERVFEGGANFFQIDILSISPAHGERVNPILVRGVWRRV